MMEKDKPYGWIVVLAAFMSHCLTHGIVYSYGILFLSLRDAFNGTKAELGWIVSLTTGSLYLSGPLASILVRRLGSRAVAIIGTLIASFGYILTIFSPSLYFMYFSLGFLSGLGYGLIFIPCVVDVTIRFDKYRALACGTAVSGAGFGAFVVSPLITVLAEEYAWRGTLLIQAAIILNCIPCAMAFSGKNANAGDTKNNSSFNEKKKAIIHRGQKRSLKLVKVNTAPDKCYKEIRETNDVETNDLLYPLIETDTEQRSTLKEIDHLRNEFETTLNENNDLKNGTHTDSPIKTNNEARKTAPNDIVVETNLPKDHQAKLDGLIHETADTWENLTNNNSGSAQSNVLDIIMEYNDEITVLHNHDRSENQLDKTNRKTNKESCIQISSENELHKDMSLKSVSSGITFFGLLKRKEMFLFYSSQVLFIGGLYQPFVSLPELALSLGIAEYNVAWIISIIGISTVIGRIVLGYLSDRQFMNRVCLYKMALLIAGISTALVPILNSFELLVGYSVMYGLSTAVLLSQTTVVLVDFVGMETMADAMGLNNMFSGFGALLGPPILGLMYDQTGSHLAPFLAAGLGMVLGSCLQCLMPLVTTRHPP